MFRTLLILILGGLLMTTTALKAQTDNDTNGDTAAEETDPVVEALEREKKIAELKMAIAEAEKGTLAAKLPSTEGSGISGSVTFGEGTGYFAEILAYQAMVEAAQQVAKDVGKPTSSGEEILVVTGDDLAKSAQLWEIANTRVEDANQHLLDLIKDYPPDHKFKKPEAAAAAMTAASALLGAAADIASFFRTDLTVTARAVNIPPTALVAQTSASLTGDGWTPIIPEARLKKTTILEKIEQLLTSRRDLAERRRVLARRVQPDLIELAQTSLELQAAKEDLAKAKAAKPADAASIDAAEKKIRDLGQKSLLLGNTKAGWEWASAEIDATLTATDALVKALLEGADGKPSPVEVVAVADVAKSKPTVKILRLEISSQGGEMHVRKGTFSTRLTYVGGLAVTYLVLDHDGAVSKSGVIARPVAKSIKAKDAADQLTIGGGSVGALNP